MPRWMSRVRAPSVTRRVEKRLSRQPHKLEITCSNHVPATMAYADRREYMRNYQREWIARRRADYLSDKVCVDCGSSSQLEVDHVDRTTKISHRIWSWNDVRRLAELAKCVTRCHDCHLTRTISQVSVPIPHGTHSGYAYHRCRCPRCTKAQREYNRFHR